MVRVAFIVLIAISLLGLNAFGKSSWWCRLIDNILGFDPCEIGNENYAVSWITGTMITGCPCWDGGGGGGYWPWIPRFF